MASKSSTIVVKVISDASQAQRELADTASRIEGFQKKLVGAAVGLFAFDKIMGGVKAAVTAASELQQSMGGVDAVFKQNAAAVHAWASDTSDSVRIPQAAYEQLATVIGAQLKNAGVSMSELAPKTRDLMELGADLAAQFGTDIPTAIEAVSSALKGERDPIERYGVSLKQASIDAKALELAQGDQAVAATQAMQAQATLAIIYEQTGDAAGAAARESETFQAKLDSLHEKATNAAAEIGGPLLTAFGSLADRAGDLIPALQPIAQGIANLVELLATLPTPVLLVIAAFAGLLVVGPSIVKLLAAIGPAIVSVKAAWAGMAVAFANPWFWAVAAGLVAIGAALVIFSNRAADAAAAAAKFKSNVSDYQGIIHKAVMGLTTGIESGLELREAAYSHVLDAFDGLIKSGGTVISTFAEVGVKVPHALDGLMGNATAAQDVIDHFNTKIVDLQKQLAEPIITPEGLVIDPLSNKAIEDNIKLTQDQRDAYEKLIPEIAQARLEEDARNGVLGEGAQAAQAAIDKERDLKKALEDAQKAASQTAGNQMLEGVKRASEDAARAVGIFNAAMEDLTGRSSQYESTTLKWADGIRSVADAGREFVEANGRGSEALKNWDIGALAATESGSKLAASLIAQGQTFGEFVTQAFEASGGAANLDAALGAAHVAADQAYNDFLSIADSMGLSAEEAQQLAGKLGIVNAQQLDDKVFEIIAQDENARAAVAALQAQGVDPKTIQFVADTDPAKEGMQAGLTYIDAQTGEPKTITITGDAEPAKTEAAGAAADIAGQPPANIPVTATTDQAWSAVQLFAQAAGALKVNVVVTATSDTAWSAAQLFATAAQALKINIPINADPGPARAVVSSIVGGTYQALVRINGEPAQVNNVIRAVIGGQYSTTIHLQGDSVPVNNVLRAVIGGQYSTTVHINGDNSGAISAIRGVTTGYYSAMVHISAEASGFWSVWNSLPTSKTITVTTQNINVPAPAPAPAQQMLMSAPAAFSRLAVTPMGFGAPVRVSGGGSGGGTNITINMGVGDPVAVGREIRKVLRSEERRAGAVRVI